MTTSPSPEIVSTICSNAVSFTFPSSIPEKVACFSNEGRMKGIILKVLYPKILCSFIWIKSNIEIGKIKKRNNVRCFIWMDRSRKESTGISFSMIERVKKKS